MTNKFKIIIAVFIMGILFSCDENSITFPEDKAYISFSDNSANFTENDTTLTVELGFVTSTTERVECTISTSIEGIDNPAIENTDFEVSTSTIVFENGVGYANATFSLIDNSQADGKKQFYLEISSATGNVNIGIDGKEKILITIIDDEHPLAYFNGTYTHQGNSYWGSDYNFSKTTNILTNPDNDNQILIYYIAYAGLAVLDVPVVATVDEAAKTITIASKQIFTGDDGWGYTQAFNAGVPSGDNPEPLESDVVGVYAINDERTEITISLTNWGVKWMEPDGTTFNGWWWYDFYTSSTLTKD